MEGLDYWRLCDELSVIQAALLTVDVDPSSEEGSNCESWKPHERPHGYEAAKTAIANALRSGVIEGCLSTLEEFDYNGHHAGFISGSIDIPESRVKVDSLRAWLTMRGMKTGFFFPATIETADYLDSSNPRYAPKLAAAVRAWQATADTGGKTPKQALEKWLRQNAAKFSLADDEGKPNETGIEETAKVANWRPNGGATKTPGG